MWNWQFTHVATRMNLSDIRAITDLIRSRDLERAAGIFTAYSESNRTKQTYSTSYSTLRTIRCMFV